MSLDVYLNVERPVTKDKTISIGYSANITHNLTAMAREAGIYEELWRPDVTKAKELIKPLTQGLIRLASDPDHYKQFNPSNEWGSYEVLLEFVAEYILACQKYPMAKVSVSR